MIFAVLDETDCNGDTALHAAARNNHSNVVRMLLQAEADHSILNSNLMTPLHEACCHGHIDVVKVSVFDRNCTCELFNILMLNL